jgi:beta-xylosidase
VLTLLVLLAVLVAPAAAGAAAPDPPGHDPTLIRDGERYVTVTTGEGDLRRRYLPLRTSTDLVGWEPAGTVFTRPPAWIVHELGWLPTDLWAPDISHFAGRYHLYYAASQAYTNNSVIGLATNATLDPLDPRHEWRDEGMVVRSTPGVDLFSAIDPEVALDRRGRPWLAYGSFWTGIRLQRIDEATGKLLAGAPVHMIASRPPPSAVEAAAIMRRGGFYYLFTSFDLCCRGVDSDYRLMVGRSRALTGPYADRDGVPLTAGGGTQVLAGYGRYAGPGHADVLREDGADLLVHHYYDREDGGRPRLSVRELAWRDGWPEAGEPLSERPPAVRWNAAGPASWRSYASPSLHPPPE